MQEPRYRYWLGQCDTVRLYKDKMPSYANSTLVSSTGVYGAIINLPKGVKKLFIDRYTVGATPVNTFLYDSAGANIGGASYISDMIDDMPENTAKVGVFIEISFSPWLQEAILNMQGTYIDVDFLYLLWQAVPFCKNLAKKYTRESGQMFLRESMSGNLSFHGRDFDALWKAPFGSKFLFIVDKYTIGKSSSYYDRYITGIFNKADCTFDYGKKKCTPKISERDRYKALLDGWEDEYDLVKLGTPRTPVKNMAVRPVIQVWVAGSKTVCNYLGGLYWHTEVDVDEGEIVNLSNPSDDTKDIIQKYHFAFQQTIKDANGADNHIFIRIVSAIQKMPNFTSSGVTVTYATAKLDAEDPFIQANRNYSWVMGATVNTSEFYGSTATQDTETPYGITDKEYGDTDVFFSYPGNMLGKVWHPLCRDRWGDTSLWVSLSGFRHPATGEDIEPDYRKEYTMRDAFTVADAIKVLLKKVNAVLKHEGTEEYSEFLYGSENPLGSYLPDTMPCVTQRTNVLKGNYDQAAQKCPVTLKGLLDMLRDVFKCYWFIDDENRLRLEHVSWFMNGGGYSVQEKAALDFTESKDRFNRQLTGYFQTQVSFDNEGSQIPKEYVLTWGEESSYVFDDVHIGLKSKNIDKKKKEETTVTDFCADVDRMLFQPEDYSEEGMVLLCQERHYKNVINLEASDYENISDYMDCYFSKLNTGSANPLVANGDGSYSPNAALSGASEVKHMLSGLINSRLSNVTFMECTGTSMARTTDACLFVSVAPLSYIKIELPDCAKNAGARAVTASFFKHAFGSAQYGVLDKSKSKGYWTVFYRSATVTDANDSTKYVVKVPEDANLLVISCTIERKQENNNFPTQSEVLYTPTVYEVIPVTDRVFDSMDMQTVQPTQTLKDEYGKPFTPSVQNWYASLIRSAAEFYKYGLPAAKYDINKVNQSEFNVPGGYVKKIASHKLRFPSEEDPDPNKVVKTELGLGAIDSMSVDLDSRTVDAEIVYDPEKITTV